MEKKCSKCGEVKPHSDYYLQSHKGRSRIEACCKACANLRRGKRKAKAAGHEYIGRKGRKEQSAQRAAQRQAEKANRPKVRSGRKRGPEKSAWEKAAQKQLQLLKQRAASYLLCGWERKAANVIKGLRTRDIRQDGGTVIKTQETTWQKASLKQFKALKARTTRRTQDAWKRKVASVERNQRRRFSQRKKRESRNSF